MQALTVQRWSSSAFRTLGLSATASQAQIDQAARRMRIWPDSHSVPPTPWDLPWLGPINRNRNDIEQAIARLSEPASRIEERLLWFHGSNPVPWSVSQIPALAHTLGTLAGLADPASAHDYALARLQLALIEDEGFSNSDRWQKVLGGLSRLSQSDHFLDWMLQVEQNSDFEKRAQIEEIARIIGALPASLAGALAARAEMALEQDDPSAARRILTLLRSAAPSAAAKCEAKILGRIEDLLERHCGDIHDQLARIGAPGINQKQIQTLCGKATRIYNDRIDPLLAQILDIGGPDSDLHLRGRTAAARVMGHIGQCWAMAVSKAGGGKFGRFSYRARNMKMAQRTFEAALALGEGTPLESAIRDNLERCKEAQGRGKAMAPRAQVAKMYDGQAFIPTYARRAAKAGFGSTRTGSGSGLSWGIWVAVCLLGVALRGFMGDGSSSHSPAPYQLPAPRGNYPSYWEELHHRKFKAAPPPDSTPDLPESPTLPPAGPIWAPPPAPAPPPGYHPPGPALPPFPQFSPHGL